MDTIIAQNADRSAWKFSPVLRRLFIALVIALPSGFPLILVGIPQYLSVQLQVALIAACVGLRVTQWVVGHSKVAFAEAGMLLVVAYFLLVSFISNSFIFPVDPLIWLPGVPAILPILLLLAFSAMNFTVREVLDGLIIACVAAAGTVVLDQYFPISAFNSFVHLSSQGNQSRRIVLLHNQTAFAFVIVLARLMKAATPKLRLRWLAALALISFSMFEVAESRLVIGAALVGSVFYLLFIYQSRVKPLVLLAAFVVAAMLAPLVLGKYIEYATSLSSLSEDLSVRYREYEIAHFRAFFEQTGGVGLA